jgi:SET domain-containing protein
MINSIQPPKKIVVQSSPIHGLGVFCVDKIYSGELIEECPILTLPIEFGEVTSLLIDYRFNWPSGSNNWREQVVALGFGSFYNHSSNPNAYWYSSEDRRTFHFIASRDIEVGEEIFVWYGDEAYWNDGRTHIDRVI